MDALKYAANMLAELKTSTLTPKFYYELYMAIFDELRHLSLYLYEGHLSKRHSLSDLYELVQYASALVPRLYLMITVGAVYMRVSRESEEDDIPPVKELMNDMLEMARGVQHPTRGLFLRYYLSVMTRDHLPDGIVVGPHGTIDDSIGFILNNFIEMNKLWVRLQFQGHSRERAKREQERKDLRLLLGSNLVRLSQLDQLSLEMYQTSILPKLLEEIVSCRDLIAQDYLMEVIIQIFPDDFHLRCLDAFLSATTQLQRTVNVKQIFTSLIDRFSNFATRAREEPRASATQPTESPTGIPSDVALFDIFWAQVTELLKARPELTILDSIELLKSLSNLASSCYPEALSYVDMVLGLAVQKMLEAQNAAAPELNDHKTRSFLLQLLLGPVQSMSPLSLLGFPSSSAHSKESNNLGGYFTDLLFLQPFTIRRQVAHAYSRAIISAHSTSGLFIDSLDGVHLVFGEVCSIMVRDQIDGSLFGPKASQSEGDVDDIPLDWEDAVEEQTLMAKLIHTLKSTQSSFDQDFELLSAVRIHFGEGGNIRIRFTLPPLVTKSIFTARKYALTLTPDSKTTFLNFAHETISTLSKTPEYFTEDESNPIFQENIKKEKIGHGLMAPPNLSLRLYLLSAQIADELGEEEMSYEFFVQALSVYEDAISESKAQFSAMELIIGTLYTTRVFGFENYETLITKCAVHCSRFLKRVDQCRGVALASHLFWLNSDLVREEGKPAYRDGKRVLECLQKALKIADSVMDRGISVDLFVQILDRYIWYYENKNEAITSKYLNSLIDLIQTNLNAAPIQNVDPVRAGTSSLSAPASSFFRGGTRPVSESTLTHFKNILTFLKSKKGNEAELLDSSTIVPGMSAGFAASEGGRWGSIILPTP